MSKRDGAAPSLRKLDTKERHLDSDLARSELNAIAASVLPRGSRPTVERVTSGGSTPVYRIHSDQTTLYLRLAEGADASLAPELLVHNLLHARGVRVPEVIHFESFNPVLGRSLMVTTEIPGRPIAWEDPGTNLRPILIAAGRDLAHINAIEVDGFGWIRRDRPDATGLEAMMPTLRAFALDELDTQLTALAPLLSSDEITTIRQIFARHDAWFDANRAVLAHGDFDATHIYHRNSEYSGIIDFGEIRGTDPFYDLGHAALHDCEAYPDPLLPHLIAGYSEVSALPSDAEARVHFWSLRIGVRALARRINRPRDTYHAHLQLALRRSLAVLS